MKTKSNKKRGVIYVRTARDDNESISSLIHKCEEEMQKDNVEAVHSPLTDVGSGKDFERAGLEELQKLAKTRSIDYLYVCSFDRIGREPSKVKNLIRELKDNGVTVRSTKGEFNSRNIESIGRSLT